MKIIQVCKRINNDESGKNKNHEHFIGLPTKVDADMLIFKSQKDIHVMDKRDDEIFKFSLYKNRNWVKKLKSYYDKYDLRAGDEVILERRIYDDGNEEYYIDHLKFDNIIFQKKTFYNHNIDENFQCFEKLKGNIDSFKEEHKDLITINSIGHFKRTKKKRTKNNKPEQDYFYECFEIIQNNENLLDKYVVNDLIEITVVNNEVNVTFINKGIIYEMEV